jgi:hypothetical protein
LIDFDGTEDDMDDGVFALDSMDKEKFNGWLDSDSIAN